VQSGEVHVTRRQVVNVFGILKKQNQFCVFENENQEKTSDIENQKQFLLSIEI
jgi:hypothetical protein